MGLRPSLKKIQTFRVGPFRRPLTALETRDPHIPSSIKFVAGLGLWIFLPTGVLAIKLTSLNKLTLNGNSLELEFSYYFHSKDLLTLKKHRESHKSE
jgi:hypothetical protein